MDEITVPSMRFDGFTNAGEQRQASHNVPAVRFTADDGSAFPAWEAKKLENIGEFIRGLSYDKTLVDVAGQTLVLRSSNISESGSLDYHHDLQFVNKIPASSQVLKKNDVVICMANGSTRLVGKSAQYDGNSSAVTTVGAFCSIFRSKLVISGLLFQTEKYARAINYLVEGGDGALANLKANSLANITFNIPTSSEEQQKIVSILSSVDETLSLCQRKLDLLTQAKKALMQCMFPKQGETVPELRFRGFTDTWESRKLGEDIVAIHTGTNLLGSVDNHGIPLLKMGNLRNGDFDLSRLEYLPEDANLDPQNVLRYGDFLFNTRNTLELVGKGATWIMKTGKVAFNSNIARFSFKSDIDTVFFNYLYNTSTVMKQIHARATGTTSVAAIYPKALNSVVYRVPSKDEQEKIGHFFQHMEALIDQARAELEQWREVKKSLLQKLFV